MKIFLLRHGRVEIINNEYFRCHLSSEGEKETRKFSKDPLFKNVGKIYTSTFNRAIDTARIFSKTLDLPITPEKRLNEWKLQSMNHSNYPEEEKKGWNDLSYKGVSGESLLDLKERMLSFLGELGQNKLPYDILLITHGTAIEMVRSHLEKQEPLLTNIKNQKYLTLIELEATDSGIMLLR